MEKPREARLKVGCFTFLAIFVFVAFLFWISGGSSGPIFTANRIDYVVTFDDITGLRKNAPVTIAGRPVGEVVDTARVGKQAQVTMAIDREVEIYENAQFTLVRPSLLGTPYIVVDPGSPSEGTISYNPYDSTQEAQIKESKRKSLGLANSSSTSGLNEVVSESRVTLDLLTKILEDFRMHQTDLLTNTNQMIKTTESVLANIDRTLEERKLDEILDNVAKLTAEMNALITDNRARLETMLDTMNQTMATTEEQIRLRSEEMGALMRQVSQTLVERIDPLLQTLTELTKSLDHIVADNDRNLHETILNVRHATENLQGFTARIRADPSLLIFGDSEARSAEEQRRIDIDRDLRDNGRMPLYDKRDNR